MKLLSVFLVFFLLLGSYDISIAQEEFNGPMKSWANVKTRFGAKGDGLRDDTRAIQIALDSLSDRSLKFNARKSGYTVLYLPKGKYKITETLKLKGKIGVQIIGEDPEVTSFLWAGKPNDTMFWANGSAYYKISRLTWNGNGEKGIEALGIHWTDRWATAGNRSYASVNIEVSDCSFKNVAVGIGGGYRWNDSEIKINRCVFWGCTRAGIEIKGANALDYWIWYCRFLNCSIGVSNSRGNYHIYNSYFKSSVISDVVNDNGYYTSIRGCFSERSTAFSIDKGSSSNPFKRIFQDNIVKPAAGQSVIYHHIGKPTFLGNIFEKPAPEKTENGSIGEKLPNKVLPGVLSYAGWASSFYHVLSINNKFFDKNPYRITRKFPSTTYSVGDQYGMDVVSSGDAFLTKMPSTPQYVKREVFAVPQNASGDVIQRIILEAAAKAGRRPIVHFPFGEYLIDRPLYIPAKADMCLTGDGLRYATVIRPRNPSTFPGGSLIEVDGPSYIQISDMQFGKPGDRMLTAVCFSNVDQKGSKVQMDQIYSNADTTLFVDKIEHTIFQKNNSFFSDGNVIVGGGRDNAAGRTSRVLCFGGSYSRVTVLNGADFVSKDCWWEGATRVPLDIKGEGTITVDGTKIAPRQGDSLPIIKIGRFTGNISIMNAYIQGGISLPADNPHLNFFLWNANVYYKKNVMGTIPSAFKGKVAYAGITSQCFYKDDPYCKQTKSYEDIFVNVSDEPRFILLMTEKTRTAIPEYYGSSSSGVSNIFIKRVSFDSFHTALHYK